MEPHPQQPDKTHVSHLAIASLIIACTSILLSILAGIPAIIAAAVALHRIKRRPDRLAGAGYAQLAMMIAFLGSMILPAGILAASYLSRAREICGAGSRCAANIKGILGSMAAYADVNSNRLPIGLPPNKQFGYNVDLTISTGETDREKALAFMQSPAMAGNITSPFWILVLNQQISPKSLLCRSDPLSGPSAGQPQNSDGIFYASPQDPKHISFSIAYPWRPNAETGAMELSPSWSLNQDPNMPLMSDIAPLNGTGKPKRDVITLPPRPAKRSTSSVVEPTRMANPYAHDGQGFNVGYADGRVEWVSRPDVGQSNDNIFTSGGMPGKAPRPGEVEPITTPSSPWDTVMVPLRDGDTGKIR